MAAAVLTSTSHSAQEASDAGKPQAAAGGKTQVRLLAIGNSFSGNATRYLRDIVSSSGTCELVFGHAMIGGCPIEKHIRLARQHEADPTAPEGMPYAGPNKTKTGLKELLTAEKWQYVTIQQYSLFSPRIETYRPHAMDLVEYIRKYAPQAEIVFHQTWAYRADDTKTYVNGYDQTAMYQDLTKAYHTIAGEVGINRIVPVGDAFQLVAESPERAFTPDAQFDPKTAVHPTLPRELHSLHSGYAWKKVGEKHVLSLDTHHANSAGEFLGGCVWFEFFFNQDVRTIAFKPLRLTDEDAAFLKDIAHRVVRDGAKPKAWPLPGGGK
jgi:hypothetical protein